jgi:hypothetical protein
MQKRYTSEEKAKITAKGEARLGKQHFFGFDSTTIAPVVMEKEEYVVSYEVELNKILKSLKK